jgi:hypothetical protein
VDRLIEWLKSPVFAEAAEPEPAAAPPPPPPAGEEPAPAPPAEQPPESPWKLSPLIRAVVATVATAIGVVGLLAVVGGAVAWLRYSQVGLPTQTALSLTPKNDLVSLGATGLVIYIGLALLLVAALFAVDPKGIVTGATFAAVVLLAIGVALYVVFLGDFGGGSRALLLLAVIALAAACLRLGRATENRFLPFAVAVFFAVLLFGAAVTYRLESDQPKVQPAAILQGAQKNGLAGFFVSATDDRIYLARLDLGGRPGAVYDFKRDDKTRLAVGRRMRCESGQGPEVKCVAAAKAAVALRRQLLADRRKTTAAAKKKAKKKATKPSG